ncbi:MAG: hypothetical protein ABNG97_09740 [Sulfitobacter sp.]|jgi:hypothetical protein
MGSPFEGMSGIIAATLGDVVSIYPDRGTAEEVVAVFREVPVETGDTFGEGGFWTNLPSLKIKIDDAGALRSGDRVDADGRSWRVLSVTPGPSPATDRFLFVELEKFAET